MASSNERGQGKAESTRLPPDAGVTQRAEDVKSGHKWKGEESADDQTLGPSQPKQQKGEETADDQTPGLSQPKQQKGEESADDQTPGPSQPKQRKGEESADDQTPGPSQPKQRKGEESADDQTPGPSQPKQQKGEESADDQTPGPSQPKQQELPVLKRQKTKIVSDKENMTKEAECTSDPAETSQASSKVSSHIQQAESLGQSHLHQPHLHPVQEASFISQHQSHLNSLQHQQWQSHYYESTMRQTLPYSSTPSQLPCHTHVPHDPGQFVSQPQVHQNIPQTVRGWPDHVGGIAQQTSPQPTTSSTPQTSSRPGELAVTDQHEQEHSPSPAGVQGSFQLWDKENPKELTLMCVQKEFSQKIRKNLCYLTESLQLHGLWVVLLEAGAVDHDKIEYIQQSGTKRQQVVNLMKHIGEGPTSRFHAFLRACALTNQEHIIHILGQDPVDYGEAAAPSGMHRAQNQLRLCYQGLPLSLQPFQIMPPHQPATSHQLPPIGWHGIPQILGQANSQQSNPQQSTQPPYLQSSTSSGQYSTSHTSISQQLPPSYPNFNQSTHQNEPQLSSMGKPVQQPPQQELGSQIKLTTSKVPEQPTTASAIKYTLSERLQKAIRRHSEGCRRNLMMRKVFDFKDDDRDNLINTAKCYIQLQVNMEDHMIKLELPEADIFETLQMEDPQKGTIYEQDAPQGVRLYGPPGAGKTTFLRHIVHAWSIDFLEKGPEKWTTMVYIPARDIKTTVCQAIKDHLWCDKKDVDILMAHVEDGEGVAIAIDAIDEVRDDEVLESLQAFVHERQTRGGSKVMVSARNNLCSLNPQDFNRFLSLDGFTMEQGIEYMERYFSLGKPLPIHQTALEYVHRHKDKMEAVVCNPLKLHIFCALVEKNILDLGEDFKLEILNLFEPLESYLTTREGGKKVTPEQSQNFYKLCLFALLSGMREFSKAILTQFKIVKNYYAFLVKKDIRDKDANLKISYSFTHEMVFEYFASRHIESMPISNLRSLLLSVCCKKNLRNTQRIMFEIIHTKNLHKEELMTMMIRCILILQQSRQLKVLDKVITHLLLLPKRIQSSVSIRQLVLRMKTPVSGSSASLILHQKDDEVREVNNILLMINEAFEANSKDLRGVSWSRYLKKEGTIQHVKECLQVCTPLEHEVIMSNTLDCLTLYGDHLITVYPAGSTRWGKVLIKPDGEACVLAWSVDDMKEVVEAHKTCHLNQKMPVLRMFISTNPEKQGLPSLFDPYLWGHPPPVSWLEKAWTNLLQAVPSAWGSERLEIHVPDSFPLRCILDSLYHQHFKKHEHIEGGSRISKTSHIVTSTQSISPPLSDQEGGTRITSTPTMGGPLRIVVYVDNSLVQLFPAGSTRWGYVTLRDGITTTYAWSVDDLKEVVQPVIGGVIDIDNISFCMGISTSHKKYVHESQNLTWPYLWGEPPQDSWSEEAWTRLLQTIYSTHRGERFFQIEVPDTAPLSGLMACLPNQLLTQSGIIRVNGGTAGLDVVEACVYACEQAKVNVSFQSTCILVPESEDKDTLRARKDKLKVTKSFLGRKMVKKPYWRTESEKKVCTNS